MSRVYHGGWTQYRHAQGRLGDWRSVIAPLCGVRFVPKAVRPWRTPEPLNSGPLTHSSCAVKQVKGRTAASSSRQEPGHWVSQNTRSTR